MINKIWIFYSEVISIRVHSDFELVPFVEKDDLFSCKLVTKNAVFASFLQQAYYDDKKRNLLIFRWKINTMVKFSEVLHSAIFSPMLRRMFAYHRQ